jgi:hypothetical protein
LAAKIVRYVSDETFSRQTSAFVDRAAKREKLNGLKALRPQVGAGRRQSPLTLEERVIV